MKKPLKTSSKTAVKKTSTPAKVKTKAKPAAPAKKLSKPTPAKAVKTTVSKTVAKAKPVEKKTASKPAPKPAAKPAAKPVTKAVTKPVSKPVSKAPAKPVSKAKPAAKPVVKSAPKPVAKATVKVAAKVAVKVTAKAAPKAATKASPTPAAKPIPKETVKAAAKKAAPVKPEKAAKPAKAEKSAAVAPPVVVAPVAPGDVPARAVRPSARLAQITVPSMAQSVASTAAKASYLQNMPTQALTPPPFVAVKKDAKLANNWKTKKPDQLTDAEVMAMSDNDYMNDAQMAFFRLKLVQLKQGILANAGDDVNLMNAPSAYLDSYSENKVLYKKVLVNGVEVFEYSNNPDDELYNVRFSLVGNLQGNYVLINNQAVGKIYEYIPPIAGTPQGNYNPVVRLIAPTKIQIATVMGKYQPSEKTVLDFEWAVSNNDQNLYSNLDDNNTFKRISNTYRLVIMNDDTYNEVVAFRLSRTSVYIGFSVSFILLVGLTIALIAFTPLKYYIPGYGTKESQTALQLLKIRTDSLEQTLHYKEQYLEGIKKVLSEGNAKQLDTIPLKLPESILSND